MTTLTWHGHSAWQLDTAGTRVQVDPFLTGNPAATVQALAADFILVSHGHGDHVGDTVAIAQRTGTWDIIAQDATAWAARVKAETSAEAIVLKPGERYEL